MTSPFRFDGTGEPETEEERRKRLLREAMRAADLGIPFATPNQAQLPPVTITGKAAHPWVESMTRAQNPELFANQPELPKQLTMRDLAADVAAQPFAAASGLVTRFGEGAARLVGARGTAEALKRQQEDVNLATQPTTSFGTGSRIVSELGIGALPYMVAGGGLRGVGTSAGLTGIESQSDAGSMVQTMADLTGSETLKRIAASPVARTATDVGVDVGLNMLFGGPRRLIDELSRIRQVSRRAPQVAEQGAEAAAQVPARLQATPVGEFAARERVRPPAPPAALPTPTLAPLALPAPRPASLTPTGIPQVTPSRLRPLAMTEEFIGAQPTLAAESRSFGPTGYIKAPDNYDQTLNIVQELVHRNNVRRVINDINPGGIFNNTTRAEGLGIFGNDISPNTITRWQPATDDATVRRASAILGLIEGQDAQLPHRIARYGDPEMPLDGVTGRTFAGVITGPNESKLTRQQADKILQIVRNNGIGGGTFDEQNGLLYFVNIKRFTEQTDEQFEEALGTIADAVNTEIPVAYHGSQFYAEYLDGPDAYLAVLSTTPQDIRSARDVLRRVAPEYERFAASIGADVAYTRQRFAERDAELARKLGEEAQVTPVGLGGPTPRAFPDQLFSRLERAITAAPFEKGTPQQWQAALSKGVAAGEREWVGIDDFLKNSQSPTLTKAEVLGQFEQGKIRLGETVYDAEGQKAFKNLQDQLVDAESRLDEFAEDVKQKTLYTPEYIKLQKEFDALSERRMAEIAPYEMALATASAKAGKYIREAGYNFGRLYSDILADARRTGNPRNWEATMYDHRNGRELVDMLSPDARAAINNAVDADAAMRQKSGELSAIVAPVRARLTRLEDIARFESQALLDTSPEYRALQEDVASLQNAKNVAEQRRPTFEIYTQPGPRENYREVVLTLDGEALTEPYRHGHWQNLKNPLVHVRMTDRALPSGEKALFVEEIQSDWHQAGRKEGYFTDESVYRKRLNALTDASEKARAAGNIELADKLEQDFYALADEQAMARQGRTYKMPPEAPFKKTQDWAELGLKRVIQEAIDKGYDRVVMVRGDQAADRIAQQIQQVKRLNWATTDNGETFALMNFTDGRREVREIAKGVPANELSKYVGTDVADRIIAGSAESAEGTINGIDLKVGGEGMKAFYDKIVPNTLRDLGKSMGLKIELEPVKLFTDGDNLSFRITPEVRQKVQTEGMRLYDVTGAVPEAVRQTLASPAMSAAVGAITGAAVDEEDRFRGAFVGAMGGAGLAAGVRGTKNYLRNRAALKASGFSPELADAYTVAKGGIDFTGAEAQRIQRGQRGPFRVQVQNVFNNLTDVGRTIDVLAGKAEALGMPPEASVGTAYDIALGSDITAARALRHGLNLPGLKLVEKGGIVSPLTREIIGEPLEDVFKPLGGNVAKNEQGMTYLVALRNIGRYDAAAAQARQFDELAAQATANAEAARVGRPAAGVDDPALAQRLQQEGVRRATEAVGPRQDPLRVYGGNAERMAADRVIVEQFGQKPEFKEFANRMEQYFDNLTRYAVESGLWTAEQAARIRNSDAFYIPFKRLIEAYTGGGAPMRGRVTPGQVGAGVKRFTGSDLIIGNPAEAIAEYTAALIRRSDMYRVGETLIDTVERMGPEYAGLVTKLDANSPQVRALNVAQAEAAYRQLGMSEEDAQQMANLFMRMDDKNPVIFKNTPQGREYYLLNDPQAFRALQVLNPQDGAAAQAILTVFGPLKNITTAFATQFSPGFWLGTNIPRDVQAGAAYNRVTLGDVGFGFKEAIKSLAGRSEFAEQVSRAGMGQVSQYGGTINPEAIARQIAPTSAGQALRADIRTFAGAPMRALERVGRSTELPMRLAAARAAQRRGAEAGVTPRGQMALASRAGARATVDFRRRSGYALDRLAEGVVPYYGAGKKGLARAIQGAMEDPARVRAAAGLLTLATVFEYLLSRGPERQEFVDRPAGERARYLHYGNTRVALPQEFAVVASATRLGLAQLEQDDPFAFEQFKQSMFNVLPPIASDVAKGDFAAAVTPVPGARQAVELSRNRSAFQDRPIVSPSMMRRLPEARRYETTAPTYDVLARAARSLGMEEASPIQAEYATRGIFGRFAPAVTGLTDIAAAPLAQQQAAERVPLPMSRQPLNPVTGFTARPVTRGQTEQEYYDMRTQIQQAKTTLSALRTELREAKKRGDEQAVTETQAQVRKLVEENPTFAAVFADRTDKRIDKILSTVDDKLEQADAKRDIITAQFRRKQITGQRARQLLDENDKKRAELFRRAYAELTQRVPQ